MATSRPDRYGSGDRIARSPLLVIQPKRASTGPTQITNLDVSRSDGGKLPRVVIVGAGFGGLSAARGLSTKRCAITIIDQQNHHLFQPLLYQVATAGLSPADIAAPIRALVKNDRHTQVVLDRVVGVDTDANVVKLHDGAPLPFDYLVIATGARHSYFGHDNWAEHAHGLKTIDDATHIRRRVLIALEQAEAEADPAVRARLLTFVVIGGGPTGVEMAGAIAELTKSSIVMDFRHIMAEAPRIVLIEAGPRLLPTFPPRLSGIAARALGRLGVEVHVDTRVDRVDAAGVGFGAEAIRSATMVWAAGVQASPAATWLNVPADRAGRVIVGEDFTVPGHPRIFAIGDTSACPMPGGGFVPGIAPAAKQAGRHVAQMIASRLTGAQPPPAFRYRDHGNLATIGRSRAVADFGWLRVTGFAAWLLWSTVHIFFLVGFRNRLIVGASWAWNYLTFNRGARLITGLRYTDRDKP